MKPNPVRPDILVHQLHDLGVQPGRILLVHTAFSQVKPVAGGPRTLIAALRETVGQSGTLVMPSMSSDRNHPFDPLTTPCPKMGIVAERFWRLPDVQRSASPHAFAAIGPHAPEITAAHPIDLPHGLDSPVGRAYELDAQVLLLGVGHTANTTIHLAENLAGVRYRREKYLTILEDGNPVRFHYREIDHCCQNFTLVDRWLDDAQRQQRGTVGHATARLARSQDIVTAVTDRLRQNETVFLHPEGTDEQCDEARRSLPAISSER